MRNLLIAFTLLACQAVFAANEGLVVISSNHPEFKNGTIIDQTQTFNLDSGQSIKLVSSSGKVISLQGPYKGSVIFDSEPVDRSVLESVSELIKGSKPTDFALAVFRNPPAREPTDRLDIWGIDIRKPGKHCVRGEYPVYLWWPRSNPGIEVALANTRRSQSTVIKWEKNKKYHVWPEAIKIEEGAEYVVNKGETAQKIKFKIELMPIDIKSDMEKVAWMTGRKCKNQATRLLATVLNGN